MPEPYSTDARLAAVLRLVRGESLAAVSQSVDVSSEELNKWHRRFLTGGRRALSSPLERLLAILPSMLLTASRALFEGLRSGLGLTFGGLGRIPWGPVMNALAVVLTAIFTGLLWHVTREYTRSTQEMVQAQNEKYIFDVLSGRPFDVEFDPGSPGSLRRLSGIRLQVHVRNLTPLRFIRPRLQVFAVVRDQRTLREESVLVFNPSAISIQKSLEGESQLSFADEANDLLFNLRPYVGDRDVLRERFQIRRFYATVEAQSPGGVLWRLDIPDR